MPQNKINYYSQILNLPVFDVRDPQFAGGAKGDGIHDDTLAIQAALDAAGTLTTLPAVVQLPRGKFLVTTALVFKNDGIILQGFGQMGQGDTQSAGSTDNICSILYAGTGTQHDNTPMLRISPGDGPGGQQWYRGTAVRNISFDVSGSSRFSSGTPPTVLQLRGCSNCPEFREITVFGGIGTQIEVAPYNINSGVDAISENLRFVNIFLYGGYSPSGSVNTMPSAPGLLVTGADNIQFLGGLSAYNYGSLFALPGAGYPGTPYPIGPQVLNSLSDVPGIKIIPSILGNGNLGNLINNGIVFRDWFVTNYVVSCRISSVTISGTVYCPTFCVFDRFNAENYNKVFQVNQESGTNAGFYRTRLFIRNCEFGGQFGGYSGNAINYPPYAASAFELIANNLQGGQVELEQLYKTGDLTLDSTCTGVMYRIGPNPNGTFFDASDAGSNAGDYAKSAFVGRLLSGQTRLMGGTAPSTANAGSVSASDEPLQCYGSTVKLFNTGRTLANSGATGQIGEFCIANDDLFWHNGVHWVKVTGNTF